MKFLGRGWLGRGPGGGGVARADDEFTPCRFTPPDTVPSLVAELGARGTRAVVILTAGFVEVEVAVGKERAAELLAAAQPHLMRIVGPNCLRDCRAGHRF